MKRLIGSFAGGIPPVDEEISEGDHRGELLTAREAAIKRYLANHPVRKLQIGSWEYVLDGWLSADLNPPHNAVIFLDARERFPFPDQSFDYIFSEHMIEHIQYADGMTMLAECRRVLKPGGRLRIATPDLRVIAALCREPLEAHQRAYLQWACEQFFPQEAERALINGPALIVNNFFRAWGHQFIYDEPTLRAALERAGLRRVTRHHPGESDDPHLRGIERHGEHIGEEINRFETMVLEAERGDD